MKKVILLGLLPVFISSNSIEPLEVCYEETKQGHKDVFNLLLQILDEGHLIFVESRGNDSAIGDRHLIGNEAVGLLQIRPIMVREVNRILKIQKSELEYALEDRFDRNKSIHMFMIWKDYHHKNNSNEIIARNWNGGPRGYKKDRTVKYWNKIEKQLNNE